MRQSPEAKRTPLRAGSFADPRCRIVIPAMGIANSTAGRAAATAVFRRSGKQEAKVKAAFSLKGVILAAVILTAGSVWAESKGSMELQHQLNVAGKSLPVGTYTVKWEGTGDQLELKIYQGKNVVATTPARVVKIEAPSRYNATLSTTNSDGSSSLTQIRFGGKNYALEVGGEAGGSAAGSASH